MIGRNDVSFPEREPIGSSTYPLQTSHLTELARWPFWRSQLRRKKTAILCIHVPFCDQLFPFCGFTKLIKHDELKESYVAAVIKEMERLSATKHIQSLRVTSVFFGGGAANSLYPY
jgi:coproporphyrinogen III oxidase-like Fe-S oxidoreductase